MHKSTEVVQKIVEVTVVDRLQDTYQWNKGGFGQYSVPVRNIKLFWDGRLEPKLSRYHEDGEDYFVHNWSREDGKVDDYSDVLLKLKIMV